MRIQKKLLKLGTGTGELSATDLSANFATPTNYTPATAFIKGHLEGIDTALGSVPTSPAGDINHTTFSIANNQASPTNVTGLAFANASVRSAEVLYSVFIDATSNLFETGVLYLIQRDSEWNLSQTVTGDNTQVEFSVTALGQVQYTSANYTGFSAGAMRFRAKTTEV